jgi:hypothetical protein
MKQVKIIGLAVVAVAALMALFGAAGAQAVVGPTSLCHEKSASACANQYPSGTVLEGETKSGGTTWGGETVGAKLATNLGNVICDSKVVGHTNEATNAAGLKGEITSLTFTNCTLGTQACTVTSVNTNYSSEILTEGVEGNGTLVARAHSGGGNPGATVVCGEIINCTYTVAEAKLPVTGGAPMVANAKAENITLGKSGGKCTETAKWTATYYLTSPNEEIFVGM